MNIAIKVEIYNYSEWRKPITFLTKLKVVRGFEERIEWIC